MSETTAEQPGLVPDEKMSEVLEVGRGQAVDWIERGWRFFCSLKLMVVLMSLFTAAMAFGTFLNPKDDALADIERAFAHHPWIIDAYKGFELYAPFKSWWFTLIIMLLALNNLASSIERLPRIFLIVKNPQKKLSDAVLRGLRNKRFAELPSLEAGRVEEELASGGYRVFRTVENGVTYLFGERGRFSRFGVWLVHLALLVICAGALYGRLVSFEGTMEIPGDGSVGTFFLIREPDGTILPRPLVDEHGQPFSIRCDKFYLDTFKDGSARRYASDLVVLGANGQLLKKKKIIVNDPLHYGGMKFYQASYSQDPDKARAVMTILDRKSGLSKEVTVTPEEPFFLGDGSVRYKVVNYEQKYGKLGPAVEVVRDEGPLPAPGAKSALAKADPHSTDFWVFANYPDFDKNYRGDRYALQFKKLVPLYVTGLQIGYDPGVPWIWLGCFLMWAGLFTAFWTVHRRMWARLENGRVVLAGAAHRNKERFAAEFDALAGRLGLPAKSGRS